jgi:hypothetical protein
MSEQLFYPPNHAYFIERWDTPENLLYQYLYHCERFITHKCGTYVDTNTAHLRDALIKKLWDDGSLILPNNFTYERFHGIFDSRRFYNEREQVESFNPAKPNYNSGYYACYRWRHRDRHCGQHYQKRDHHKKKEKNLQKEAWREYKQFAKDKRKSKFNWYKARSFCKTLSNHYHRRWVKENTHRKNWDAFHTNQQEYVFKDPWMFD